MRIGDSRVHRLKDRGKLNDVGWRMVDNLSSPLGDNEEVNSSKAPLSSLKSKLRLIRAIKFLAQHVL
jgi:hypothetical protein